MCRYYYLRILDIASPENWIPTRRNCIKMSNEQQISSDYWLHTFRRIHRYLFIYSELCAARFGNVLLNVQCSNLNLCFYFICEHFLFKRKNPMFFIRQIDNSQFNNWTILFVFHSLKTIAWQKKTLFTISDFGFRVFFFRCCSSAVYQMHCQQQLTKLFGSSCERATESNTDLSHFTYQHDTASCVLVSIHFKTIWLVAKGFITTDLLLANVWRWFFSSFYSLLVFCSLCWFVCLFKSYVAYRKSGFFLPKMKKSEWKKQTNLHFQFIQFVCILYHMSNYSVLDVFGVRCSVCLVTNNHTMSNQIT